MVCPVEDGGGAQSAGDIGFGYFNGNSSLLTDFGGIGYASTFGVSSGAPAVFDTDGNGESWGVLGKVKLARHCSEKQIMVPDGSEAVEIALKACEGALRSL